MSPPPPPLSLVKFEDCQHSKEVGFESSDPNFSVRPDGSVYAEQEVANLSEPIQFMVTARGGHDPHIWETTVKLALVGHQPSVPVSQVNIYTLLSFTLQLNRHIPKVCLRYTHRHTPATVRLS